jgi:YggT family protein
MLRDMLDIVVWYVGVFFVFLFLLRFYFQWLRVPFRNQLGEFILALTSWAVVPARRVIPSVFKLDLASWMCAWLLQALILAVRATLRGRDLSSSPGIAASIIFAQSLVDLVIYSVQITIFVVILMAVLSWFAPYHPMQQILDALTRPLLRPIRRVVPLIANIDLSPAVLLLVLILLLVPLAALRESVAGLF